MRSLTLTAAPDGGFVVMDFNWIQTSHPGRLNDPNFGFRFAGSLAECLDYMRKQMEAKPDGFERAA